MIQKKLLLIAAIFITSVFPFYNTIAQEAPQENPYVILVEYTVDETNLDTVIDLLSEMQRQTLENEDGCLVYDVLLGIDDSSKIFIYESYRNETAFRIHTNSRYFKEIVPTKLKKLIKQEKITRLSPLNFEGEMDDAEM